MTSKPTETELLPEQGITEDRARALASNGGWLPIESAPKTGRILIANSNWVQESEWFSPEQRWWDINDDEVFTHWMPLPSPPKEQQ